MVPVDSRFPNVLLYHFGVRHFAVDSACCCYPYSAFFYLMLTTFLSMAINARASLVSSRQQYMMSDDDPHDAHWFGLDCASSCSSLRHFWYFGGSQQPPGMEKELKAEAQMANKPIGVDVVKEKSHASQKRLINWLKTNNFVYRICYRGHS